MMKNNDIKESNEENQEEMELDVNINTDENIDGHQHLTDPVQEEDQFQKLQDEISQLNDKFLRQAAEFDNFKRRTAREKIELIQTAGKEVITELLEVLDDVERAEKQMDASENVEQLKQGLSLVFSKFRNVLNNRGLKPMEVVGQEFNPDIHEAVTEIDGGAEMKGKVFAEVSRGYYLNDKIIRFAKVVVGK